MSWLRMLPVAALAWVPSSVLACPQCAGNNDGGDAFFWLLGGMILLPFGAFGLVAYIIKRGSDMESAPGAAEEQIPRGL